MPATVARLLLTIVLVLVASRARADRFFWNNPGSGSFSDPNNWDPTGVPGTNDQAVVGTSIPTTINLSSATVFAFDVGSNSPGSVNLIGDLTARTLAFTGQTNSTGANITVNGSASLGNFFGGNWTLDSASSFTATAPDPGDIALTVGINNTPYTAGVPHTAPAVLNVNGGRVNISSVMAVGVNGVGEADFSNGATLTAANGPRGGAGVVLGTAENGAPLTSGTMSFDGAGTTAKISSGIEIGQQGAGILKVSGGATINISSSSEFSINMATQLPSQAMLNISGLGSKLSAVGMFAGAVAGTGTTSINSGGTLLTGGADLGLLSTANATVTVDGVGSTWTSSDIITVGDAGTGNLAITGGGTVTANAKNGFPSAFVGYAGTGAVSVDGANSSLDTAGPLVVGQGGMGSLTVSNGGQVAAGAGGTSQGLSLGYLSGSSGSLTLSGGGTIDVYGLFDVGVAGTGTVGITSGGAITTAVDDGDAAVIGDQAGAMGTVTIDGEGSKFGIDGGLVVGQSGTGSLSVSSGATVSISSTDTEIGLIVGFINGSKGNLTIDGAGSKVTVIGSAYIGHAGNGTLNLQNGAALTTHPDLNGDGGVLGEQAASMGTATIDAATWDLSGGTLIVGRVGIGLLTVQNGGQLNSGNDPDGAEDDGAAIGDMAGGSGTVTISGTGSSWNQKGVLSVGHYGQGTLTVAAGGSLRSADGYIGQFPGAAGNATVTGANSTWIAGDVLSVASDLSTPGGGGSLVVSSGGAVMMNDVLNVGPQGVVNVIGGRIVVGSGGLQATAGTLRIGPDGLLNNSGTIVGNVINDGTMLNSGTSHILGGISGEGATSLDAGSDLTVDFILQGSLTIDGNASNPATLTIQGSDANGNPLGQSSDFAMARSLTPFEPLEASGIISANLSRGASELADLSASNSVASSNPSSVPEPSTLMLVLVAIAGLAGQWIASGRRAYPNDF